MLSTDTPNLKPSEDSDFKKALIMMFGPKPENSIAEPIVETSPEVIRKPNEIKSNLLRSMDYRGHPNLSNTMQKIFDYTHFYPLVSIDRDLFPYSNVRSWEITQYRALISPKDGHLFCYIDTNTGQLLDKKALIFENRMSPFLVE